MTTLNQSHSPLAQETTSSIVTVEDVLIAYRTLQDEAIDAEVANLDIDMDMEVTV